MSVSLLALAPFIVVVHTRFPPSSIQIRSLSTFHLRYMLVVDFIVLTTSNLLGAPSTIGLSHVLGWLDARHKLENNVGDTNKANDGSEDFGQDMLFEKDRSGKDVENSTTNEREQERSVSGDLGRNLEFEKSNSRTKDRNIDTDNYMGHGNREHVEYSSYDHKGAHAQIDHSESIREVHGWQMFGADFSRGSIVWDSRSRCFSSVEEGETSMLKAVKLEAVGKFLPSGRAT